MLAVVVAVFATLWLPYRVLVVYNSFAINRYMELWFLMFCKTMIFINSAINPILYNVMSIKFRRAFKIMLSCGKTKRKFRGPYISVAGSLVRRQHQTVTSQVTSCTVEQLQIL
ncbi:thyrotropin-releasing hormone receptor [Nephila pilipes]|uniref:Thyrotropin-releasing hormone receptor n=1 Tax=Nephila pilipes TaxID=299642 RepID=A0A8X6NSM3_NEPPI|nr:thyrotropin-releasing hormone receptor [Nephila pilipes]